MTTNILKKIALNSTKNTIENGYNYAFNVSKQVPTITIQNKCINDFSLYDKLVNTVFIDNLMNTLFIYLIINILHRLIYLFPKKIKIFFLKFRIRKYTNIFNFSILKKIFSKDENTDLDILFPYITINIFKELEDTILYLMMVQLLLMAWYLYF